MQERTRKKGEEVDTLVKGGLSVVQALKQVGFYHSGYQNYKRYKKSGKGVSRAPRLKKESSYQVIPMQSQDLGFINFSLKCTPEQFSNLLKEAAHQFGGVK